MKISRVSIKFFVLAVIFYLASYYSTISSQKYDSALDKYGLFHGYEEMNYWDYAGIGFFILAISTTVVAIWLRKSE